VIGGPWPYDVIFLKEPPAAKTALKSVPTKEGVNEVYAGRGVLYCSKLRSRGKSHINRVPSLSIYQSMTLRNWNTTTKLLRMMDEVSGRPR
jgi:uncharacterized protein (DUF1697 family)